MHAQPKTTLEQLLHHLGFTDATVAEHHLEEGLLLDVKSEDAGRLIGRQGQTLSELQYILNRLLFHQDQAAPKVMVDVGGYRASARDALVKKAQEAAEKMAIKLIFPMIAFIFPAAVLVMAGPAFMSLYQVLAH